MAQSTLCKLTQSEHERRIRERLHARDDLLFAREVADRCPDFQRAARIKDQALALYSLACGQPLSAAIKPRQQPSRVGGFAAAMARLKPLQDKFDHFRSLERARNG
jgi:hypothetical protein